MRIRNARTALKLATNPDLYFGEAYMDGDLVVERGSFADMMELLGYNIHLLGENPNPRLGQLLSSAVGLVSGRNGLKRARDNVAHHYDLSGALYRTFLDGDMQYSCAYLRHPDDDIEAAQLAKKEHIVAKLLLQPGQRVLDIGCGWGGLALFIARAADVRVTGITLSKEQLAVARRRARDAGLADRVTFELVDYRELDARFDRIVSIGMFEHVGLPNYEGYFGALKRLLAPKGIALVHSIGKMYGPAPTSTWILKYIFPGGYAPALSEVMPSVERNALWVNDIEILRLHYAETLAALARAIRGPMGRPEPDLRRALPAHVGVLSRRQRDLVPLFRLHGVPDAARQRGRCCPDDAGLPARRGTRPPAAQPRAIGCGARGGVTVPSPQQPVPDRDGRRIGAINPPSTVTFAG